MNKKKTASGNTVENTARRGKKRRHQLRGHQPDAKALQTIETLFTDIAPDKSLLIEYLHRIQDRFQYISSAHLVALADWLKLSPVEVFEVASFYHHFDLVKDDETPPPAITVRVCQSISCELAGAQDLLVHLQQALGQQLRIQPVPCVGRCDQAPIAMLGHHPIEQADVSKIQRALEPSANDAATSASDLSWLDFDTYRAAQGYALLQACLDGQTSCDQILQVIQDAGLRGLGGAGFPAGQKWHIVRQQPAPRYLAVNIDEGEPGTFKDRHYLERDPHRMIEGALIAAQVIEASAVYFYIRDEYRPLHAMLQNEIRKVRAHFSTRIPELHLRRGAGAYICGEESAMIESIEGKRGWPRQRPPFIAEVGLFGRPTLEHNLETLFHVREIVEQGAAWYQAQGRHGRHGFRSFSVSGRVNRPGVVRAPAGITLHELIDKYCGGMQPGQELYGYFPGGASGGILPASLADIPLDFDTLQDHDCFIGSAATIVFSRQDSARQLALNAMRFFADESCGQCTPCRVGTAKAVQLMQQPHWDQDLLEQLASTMADASICGLGQAAPNPLRCAMKYFPQEFES